MICRIFGSLILLETAALFSAIVVAVYYQEPFKYILITTLIAAFVGVTGVYIGRNAIPEIEKREGSVIVTLIWVVFSFIGMMPFWLSGVIPSFTNAFFETISGFTTTGASILDNIESMPRSLLYWRSLTQWIGGLGIIVISIALLPIFGFSSVQLFSAEATGPTKDKIRPRMSDTAKRLLAVYVVLTMIQMVLLILAGMDVFDALNHAFTTMATGGFSTKQASVGHWDSAAIQYIIIFFMFLAGINFSLFYFAVKKKWMRLKQNEELQFYGRIVLLFTLLVGGSVLINSGSLSFTAIEQTFRDSLFTVVSIITTTGYATIDYMTLKPLVWFLMIVLMLIGASAGSTAGGMKLVRILVMIKYAYYEFKRIIHPNAVVPVRYNGHLVSETIVTKVLAFILLYAILIVIGSVILLISGMGFTESVSGMITCISDVGPGLGKIGPAHSYASIPEFSKWFLSFVMLVGRLEVFTVLVIFTPVFWKN